MSKNYNNTLPIFAEEKALKKRIGKIQTDSTPLGTPLNWQNCNVFKLFSYVTSTNQQDELRTLYSSGEIGYGHAKNHLLDAYQAYFSYEKQQFSELIINSNKVDERLTMDYKFISTQAKVNLNTIKTALGFNK